MRTFLLLCLGLSLGGCDLLDGLNDDDDGGLDTADEYTPDGEDCAGDCAWPEVLARSEEALLQLVNAQRAEGARCGDQQMPPAAALRMQSQLRSAARAHSLDMGEQNYFSHDSLDGRSFSDRVYAAGYTGFAYAENIAAGNAEAQATFAQWLNSPGHCKNMLDGRYTEVGIGHATASGSTYTHYWTQNLGR